MTFTELIAIFEAGGWQALGKISNPLTGKAEVNLAAAKNTVDILMLLREKSRNNLTPEEAKLLSAVIADLQLNYADAAQKKETGTREKSGEDSPDPEASPDPGEKPGPEKEPAGKDK